MVTEVKNPKSVVISVISTLMASEQLNKWQKIKSAKTGLFSSSINLGDAVKFFLSALDESITQAEGKSDYTGSEKKELVLSVLSKIYDTVIGANLPYWAYPFAGLIKSIVIDVIVANAIDYFVGKYNEGSWKK